MKKMRARARICLFLACLLMVGVGFYIYKLALDGDRWVSYRGNGDVYTNGYLTKGAIYDKNGTLLMRNTSSGEAEYNEDSEIRTATLHAVGDSYGNIATGANYQYADKLVGYNFLTGTYSTNNAGRYLYLTIDANVCKVANEALDGRYGTVGVYNYKTGDIICMVSSPNYDPLDPPDVSADDTSGIYMNKFLSATVVPGSTFKVITATAALENIDNIDEWTYTCPEVWQIGSTENDKVTCPYNHGTLHLKDALAYSCNCAFGELSLEIGPTTLKKYVEKAGLTKSYDIDGISTAAGSFDFPSDDTLLAWTGIGQYHDLVNPCAMMCYMGAIANGGECVNPHLVDKVTFTNGWNARFPSVDSTERLVEADTAAQLEDLLHNDVVENYGEDTFSGLDLCAKSGTAEVGEDEEAHAWFYGYIRNEGYPYAFVVLVENGGSGLDTAGDVANQVLQYLVNETDPVE